jgi:hypothetical protein
VGFISLNHPPLPMKIMLLVLLRCNNVISREMLPNISPPSYSILINFKKSGEISVMQTKSCDNLADLFTKSLPYSTFQKCVKDIGMRRLRNLLASGEYLFDRT